MENGLIKNKICRALGLSASELPFSEAELTEENYNHIMTLGRQERRRVGRKIKKKGLKKGGQK